jgi:hypothetical protein
MQNEVQNIARSASVQNRGAATVSIWRTYGALHLIGLLSTDSRQWLAEWRRDAAL